MTLLFIEWLYIQIPIHLFHLLKEVNEGLVYFFSLRQMTLSLFAPWRHDTISLQRAPASLWFRIIINNVISRFIGFTVRSVTVLLGIITLLVWNTTLIIFITGWLCLPILLIASIIYGLRLFWGA